MEAFLCALLAMGPRDRFDPPRARSVETLAVTAERLLERLDAVRDNGGGRWLARCPAHDDRSPSLSVRQTNDGTVLIHCFAGCSAADVVAAVGLEFRELFAPTASFAKHRNRPLRRSMPAREGLATLDHEAMAVAIIAADIAAHREVDAETLSRLSEAVARIGRVRDACGMGARR